MIGFVKRIFISGICIAAALVGPNAVAGTINYAYDELGRLTKATYGNNDSVAYSYDAVGNRTSVSSQFFDFDGDGIPDAWENANGLNPNDPNDATLDADSDGLSNLQEFQARTNPNLADTDGDGTLDGADANPLFKEDSIGAIIQMIMD